MTAKAGRGDVVVDVKDSGMGLSPEFLPHVFDLFVQGFEEHLVKPVDVASLIAVIHQAEQSEDWSTGNDTERR